jgi:hypothetical protein
MAKAKPKPKPAITGAERQAAYRKRRKAGRWSGEGADQVEIKAWIDRGTRWSLARQARHYGVTNREMLERVIRDGQTKTLGKIRDTAAEDAFWKALPASSR